MYTSITSKKKTKLGWQIELDDDKVFLNNFGNAVIYWELSVLKKILQKKLNQMILVYADFKKNNLREELFKYKDFYLVQYPDLNSFTNLIQDGSICIDLAIHREISSNIVKDKGFLFRVSENKIDKLFRSVKKII